jgi:2,4-dienoyl-CoA reductase-like NADH-dependent reductase (Old Yellow Enzyme family)
VGLDKIFLGGQRPEAAAATGLDPLVARFEAGEFDLAAVGRALISDADWVNKHANGRLSDIVPFDPIHQKTLL